MKYGVLEFVTGFIVLTGPLGFMASKEGPEYSSSIARLTFIATVIYILFWFWPPLMDWPYGWLLRWIYE